MLLRDTTETIRAAAQSTPIVDYATYAPAGTDEALTTRLAPGHDHDPGGLRPGPAGVEGGFGRCLLHAAQALFAQGHDAACVLSSGTPTLGPGVITAATLPLAGSERPVDGGYYLLGMRRPHAGLFAEFVWSTDTVAAATRDRAAVLDLDLFELPLWYDVDNAAGAGAGPGHRPGQFRTVDAARHRCARFAGARPCV